MNDTAIEVALTMIASINNNRRAIKEAIELLEGLTLQDCSVAKKAEEDLRKAVIERIDAWQGIIQASAATVTEHDEWYRRFESLRP